MDRILGSAVDQFKANHDLDELESSEIFESFCSFCIIHSLYEDEFNPEEFRIGGGHDLSIDSAAVLVNGDLLIDKEDIAAAANEARAMDVHFVLIQSKSSAKFSGQVITDLADNLVQIFDSDQPDYPVSPEIENLQECVSRVYDDIGKLRSSPRLSVFYATSGRVTEDKHLENKRNAAVRRLEETKLFSDVCFQLLGARELRELYRRATTTFPINFTMEKKISIPKIPGVEQAFLGLLPAPDLISIVTDNGGGIRKSVFFDNVRDFQDYNTVNKNIRATIRDASRRRQFAVLNNGVTIVARELRTAGDDVWISDFQIVNGCQTCHVLFDEQENLDESVWIPVKIIESREDDVVTGITAATNRQTAVSDEDLEAKERFHKDLEDLFSSFDPPRRLYYERRSEQYRDQQNIEKTRIIDRGQLTRAFSSVFLDEPTRAARAYKSLRESRKSDLFQEHHAPFVYYTSAVVLYRIEWLIRNKKIDRKYGPAKYHFMSAFKKITVGREGLPQSPRAQEKKCSYILDIAWDSDRSTELAKKIVTAAERAIAESHTSESERDFLRSQVFANSLDQALEEVANS